jgi:hypothetical protein
MAWGSCSEIQPPPFACPTLQQSIDATTQLLPHGRAWPANSRGMVSNFLAWLGDLAGTPSPAAWPPGFVQTGFFAAIGAVRNFVETELCALRLEFWCATETLTNDLWMAEYGLPDDCDPFPDLCAKVGAMGGRRCELYQELCARNGWIIECAPANCAGSLADCALADCAVAGGPTPPAYMVITVYLGLSPAYQGAPVPAPAPQGVTPLADCAYADIVPTCPQPALPAAPDLTTLECLMQRIAPAHVVVSYVTQWAPG